LLLLLQLIHKRPLSPDVFELNSLQPHYKMPWGAMSSIMNRATGAALSAGGGTADERGLLQGCAGLLTSWACR